jgi:16S rRNA (guanine966-N2)-methyltransferase
VGGLPFYILDCGDRAAVYILAGKYKGRKLLSPPTDSVTRPVTGLVKKSLFGMLSQRVEDAVVVDLFCGTGTMGLEALSQGARACWFGESDRRVIDRLRRNIETFGAAAASTIWPGDVTHGLDSRLEGIGTPVDLAFVDPPYETAREWNWRAVADTIFFPLYKHLAEEGVVVLRLPQDVTLGQDMGGLVVERMRQYGKMVLALLGKPKAV